MQQAGRAGRLWPAVIVLVGVYAGHVGAGSGIVLLAVLSMRHTETFAVTNAIKNLGTGMANVIATVAYLVLAPSWFGSSRSVRCGWASDSAAWRWRASSSPHDGFALHGDRPGDRRPAVAGST